MEANGDQLGVPVPDGTRQVRVEDLKIGNRVLSDPVGENPEFLNVTGVEHRGGFVFVHYLLRHEPVEYETGQILFVQA